MVLRPSARQTCQDLRPSLSCVVECVEGCQQFVVRDQKAYEMAVPKNKEPGPPTCAGARVSPFSPLAPGRERPLSAPQDTLKSSVTEMSQEQRTKL